MTVDGLLQVVSQQQIQTKHAACLELKLELPDEVYDIETDSQAHRQLSLQ